MKFHCFNKSCPVTEFHKMSLFTNESKCPHCNKKGQHKHTNTQTEREKMQDEQYLDKDAVCRVGILLTSNVESFVEDRQFPKDNPIDVIEVQWDEMYLMIKDVREGNSPYTYPYFIKTFKSFDEASAFIIYLMGGFTHSQKILDSVVEEDLIEEFEPEYYSFKCITRIKMDVQFEKESSISIFK